jgi:hypothetical protein
MNFLRIKNPIYIDSTRIDLTIETDEGDLPFTYDPDDTEQASLWVKENIDLTQVSPYVAPVYPIELLKEKKKNEIANARYEEEVSGYVFKGQTFHSDRQSQDRIFQAYMASLNDSTFAQTWKTKDGWAEMTATDFVNLYNEFQTFLQGLYLKEKGLQDQIDLATTPEELNQISW